MCRPFAEGLIDQPAAFIDPPAPAGFQIGSYHVRCWHRRLHPQVRFCTPKLASGRGRTAMAENGRGSSTSHFAARLLYIRYALDSVGGRDALFFIEGRMKVTVRNGG